jgi:hypothetical protein
LLHLDELVIENRIGLRRGDSLGFV